MNFTAVQNAVSSLSCKASPGLDGVPTKCLKYGGDNLIKLLVIIFSWSLELAHVPVSMKVALISPFLKGGDRALLASY